MAGIDHLFKKPLLPTPKRKFDTARDPNEIYKATKVIGSDSVRRVSQTVVDDGAEDEDVAAGPEMPPEMEDGTKDDEEGRFFGGGISKGTVEALNFIDERENDGQIKTEKIDFAWLRKLALNFEKKITKNAELRAKFEDDPQKFMGSEADLDADVKALSILSEHPELYEEFSKLGCVSSLVSLLSHENTDIAIDAIEIISELIDEDVEAESEQWDALVDALLEADLLDLLYQNIARLDENLDSDRTGVYHILSVLESLSSRPSITELIGKHQSLIPWLMSRTQKKESIVRQNKQYAAEILAILLQSSVQNRSKFAELEGIDAFLQVLAAYRKRDPIRGTEEEEFLENVFDLITCMVDEVGGKQKFLDAEGIELCLIMLKEGKMSRPRALRLLDHALGGSDGGKCSERLVEAAGLKPVFTAFMRKQDAQSAEHLLGLLASMLRSLPADSAPRIRLLAKFVERNYEKITRLLQLRREYASRLSIIDQDIRKEHARLSATEQEEQADERLSRRLDGGLFSLQTIDVILSWLVAEDDGAGRRIRELLAERDEGLGEVKRTLEEQMQGMSSVGEGTDEGLRDMLTTLIGFL